MSIRAAAIIALLGLAATACTAETHSDVTNASLTTTESSTTQSRPDKPLASDDPQQPLKDAFPALMQSYGYFPGMPDYVVDGQANAVCGALQTGKPADVIKQQASISISPGTGMKSRGDVIRFVTAAVAAYCPEHAAALPTR